MKRLSSIFLVFVLAATGCRRGIDDDLGDGAVVDGDLDADADGDVDGDVDVDADSDADSDSDADGDADQESDLCSSLAEARAAATGATHLAVDLTLCGLVVTYVHDEGFFAQQGPTGPGIQVYEGSSWTADVSEGDEISLRATEVHDHHGTEEVTAHGPVTVHATGVDVVELAQDLSTGTRPGEDLESELVALRDATVVAIDGQEVTIAYGSAPDVRLRAADVGELCVGAVFDILAVVTEWRDSDVHRLESFRSEDILSLDTRPCAPETRPPGPGDLLINELLVDPAFDLAGDANCDGERDGSDDEFIEIVNVSAATLSLGEVAVYDATGLRHRFPEGTLAPMGVVVVYGGGTPSCSFPAAVQVQTASAGFLGLNNAGDTLTIVHEPASGTATTLLAFTYGGEGEIDESLTLSPDLDDEDPRLTGLAGFVPHSGAATSGGALFSPGSRVDGSPF